MDFAASGSEVLQRRMQQIVDGELASERFRQVEDLAAKVSALERDRQKAKDDLNATEQRYRVLIEQVREQLSEVNAEHGITQRDIASLEQRLREGRRRLEQEQERYGLELGEHAARAEAEVHRLTDLHSRQEAEIQASRSEICDMRLRLDELYNERSLAQEESMTAAQATLGLREALEQARRRLEDAEQRRAVVRDRYLQAGVQFEDSIQQAEMEGHDLITEEQSEYRRAQKKYDKYKQRYEAGEVELSNMEAAARAQQASLEDKASEITRLHRALEVEQAALGQQEMRHLQCQQEWLPQNVPDAQQMISVRLHEQLLEEQAMHFRERMHDVESKLQLDAEIPAQHVASSSSYEPSPPRRAGYHSRSSSAERRRGPPVRRGAIGDWAPRGPSSSPTRQALSRAAREEATKRANERARTLDSELRHLRQSHRHVQAVVARTEEQQRTFAESIREANSHFERLQRIIGDEREAEEAANAGALRAREEAASAQEEVAALNSQLRDVKRRAAENERLSVSIGDCAKKVAFLEETHERQRQECHDEELIALSLQGEHKTVLAQIELQERRGKQLEEQYEHQQAKVRRLGAAVNRMQYVSKTHVQDARHRLEQLRGDAQSELQRLRERCTDQAEHLCMALRGQQRQATLQEALAQSAREDAARKLEALERRALEAAAENSQLEQRLETSRASEQSEEQTLARLQAAIDSRRRFAERLVSAAASATPGAAELEALKARVLGSDAGLDAPELPSLLAALREGLTSAHGRARKAAETAESVQAEAAEAAELRKLEGALAGRVSALEGVLATAESRREELSVQVRERRAELQTHREARAERRREAREDVALCEGELGDARKRALSLETEADSLARQLQSLRIEASLSVELSRSDAAEPYKHQLYDLLSEVDELQQRFQREVRELEREWKARCADAASNHEEELAELRRRLTHEADAFRSQLSSERAAEADAVAAARRRAGELAEQLARRQADLDERSAARQRLSEEGAAAAREEAKAQGALQAGEARLAQAQETRKREQEAHAERRAELLKRQERELADLRRSTDAEVSALRAQLQHSITGLSVAALDDEESRAKRQLRFAALETASPTP
eukprot:TRINITY_DN16285_c0_g1_i1.p1 TRINITY_DN16285_c0_g1~~TRINITY_DN16285_c0_g1_i1.p1  ORF type:complete len:1233 (-),score=376.62 TRINITY_DN16285_c0_g1_i1:50-3349(-)